MRSPGGAWRDRVQRVFGVPEFARGERVVVFAAPTRSGPLTVTGLFQGKFRIEADAAGGEAAVQDPGTGAEVAGGAGAQRREALGPFLESVRGLVLSRSGRARAEAALLEAPAGADEVAPSFTFVNPIIPLRWFEPDAGGAVALGRAALLASEELAVKAPRLAALRDRLEAGLRAEAPRGALRSRRRRSAPTSARARLRHRR